MSNFISKSLGIFGVVNQEHKSLIFFTNFFGFIFLVLLLIFCVFFTRNEWYENLIITSFGLLLGWFIAMLFSPYSEKDGTVFSSIFKAASIFFSGYLVSEISKHPIDLKTIEKKDVIEAFFFLSSILLSWLVVFSNRIYLSNYEKTKVVTPNEQGKVENANGNPTD